MRNRLRQAKTGCRHACRRTDRAGIPGVRGGSRIGDPMKFARTDSKPTRTSALGDSWAYATALTRLYADYFDSLLCARASKKPLRARADDESQGPGRKH